MNEWELQWKCRSGWQASIINFGKNVSLEEILEHAKNVATHGIDSRPRSVPTEYRILHVPTGHIIPMELL